MSSGGASIGGPELPAFRIAIIGAGISGLAAAYRLQSRLALLGRPAKVTILDAADRPGGVIRTVKEKDFLLECGPDSFLAQKRRGIALCDELGLRRQLIETRSQNARSFIVRGNKLVAVPPGFYLLGPTRMQPFLLSPLISFMGKLRMFKEPWIPVRNLENETDDYDESLASFVRRRLGPEALERLAQPLVAGIYAADPETLSLRSTFPQFLDMEKHGGVLRNLLKTQDLAATEASGARYSLFASLRNGMQTLTDQLARSLPAGTIQAQNSVRAVIPRTENGRVLWRIECENGNTMDADAVCSALPAFSSAFLLRSVDPKLTELLNGIHYTDSATLQLGYRTADIPHPMNGFGFVVPAVENKFISACTFAHEKFEGRAPKGHALLRVFIGGQALTRFTGDEFELKRKVAVDLRALLGVQAKPIFSLLTHYRRALAQYSVGHHRRLVQIKDRVRQLPGFTLAGNWSGGVGVPDCIESGEDAADALWAHLSR